MLLGSLALSPPLIAATESHTHTLRFNAEDLRIGEIEAEGDTYAEITLKGLDNHGEPGDPSLPWAVYSVSVPPEAVDFRVSVNGSAPQLITLEYQPMPVQHDIPTSIDYAQPPFAPLATKYTQGSTAYPEDRAMVSGVSTIGGFNRVVTVAVTPFAWSGATNLLAMQEEVLVTLTWRTDSKAAEILLYPGFPEMAQESMELARESVVNPEAVGGYSTTLARLNGRQSAASSNEHIPYIIVTTKTLAPSLERLAALRRLRGFESKIVCIEDILADVRFKDGDVVSGINDDAGKLRAFLRDTYSQYGTKYVLLAGNYPKIPARWTKLVDDIYLSELYYRDLTSEWKILSADNGIFEVRRLKGINTDMCIGWLPTDSPDELENYINKLCQYEYNIAQIDLSYLDNAYVMKGYDAKMNEDFENHSGDSYRNNFKNLKVFETSTVSIMPGHAVIQSMNTGYWGFVDWRSHGHYAGLATCETKIGDDDAYYGINAFDRYDGLLITEFENGIDNWRSANHPSWTLSISCELAELGKNRDSDNFMQSFLFGKDYGGIVFIGNTGLGRQPSSSIIVESIFEAAVDGYSGRYQLPYVSEILNTGIISYVRSNYAGAFAKHCNAVLGLFGDPLVPLWIKQPNKTLRSPSGNFERLLPNDSLRVVYNNLTVGKVYVENDEAASHLVENIYKNIVVSQYRSDMVPHISPVEISGLNIARNDYIICEDLSFVPDSKKGGEAVRISPESNIVIEAFGKVDIRGKIQVDTASELNIRSHKSVLIEEAAFDCAGKIVVETDGSVEIGTSVDFPVGVEVELKPYSCIRY